MDMTPKEKFKTALSLRNFEVKLFWQRSNYFLALNSALIVGFFALKHESLRLPFAFFGLLTSALWTFVNLGSKFWQARWEQKLIDVEKAVYPDLLFFNEDFSEVKKQVMENLEQQIKEPLARLVMHAVLWKPSVSTMVIYLSGVCVIFWIVLLVICI